MTRITGTWLTRPGTAQVLGSLTGGGHMAFFVGGCVRDALIGRPVVDIDIATDARPNRVMELAEAGGLKAVPTGIDHGTVTVVSGGVAHEVTTFRRDVETDGRRAVVAFSDRIEDDARRRDFTMNALYATADGTVVDPVGTGIDDLARGAVRFIDDASARIREDYLRSLRFFRFYAAYGHPGTGPDPEALAAIAANLDGLDTLSAERVGHEMRRLLGAPDPAPAVAAMQATGVLARVLPGADSKALPVLVALEEGLGCVPDWLRRLAVLGDLGAADILRLARSEARDLARLREGALGGMRPGELGYRFGAETGRNALLVRAALMETPLDSAEFDLAAKGAAAVFPVSAADLMPTWNGAALGEQLRAIEARWIASGFTADRDALLKD